MEKRGKPSSLVKSRRSEKEAFEQKSTTACQQQESNERAATTVAATFLCEVSERSESKEGREFRSPRGFHSSTRRLSSGDTIPIQHRATFGTSPSNKRGNYANLLPRLLSLRLKSRFATLELLCLAFQTDIMALTTFKSLVAVIPRGSEMRLFRGRETNPGVLRVDRILECC
jgi:hypothetical protein